MLGLSTAGAVFSHETSPRYVSVNAEGSSNLIEQEELGEDVPILTAGTQGQ